MRFQITRADGRSNSQVLIDLMKDAVPGRLFGYEELSAALSAGADHTYTVADICGVVTGAGSRLLRADAIEAGIRRFAGRCKSVNAGSQCVRPKWHPGSHLNQNVRRWRGV